MATKDKEKISPSSSLKIRNWFQGIMKSMRTAMPGSKNDILRHGKQRNATNRQDPERFFDVDLKSECDSSCKKHRQEKETKASVENVPAKEDKRNVSQSQVDAKSEPEEEIEQMLKPDINAGGDHASSNDICPLWKVLSQMESPFLWCPKLNVRPEFNQNFTDELAAKHMEFAQAKPNLFRETVVRLVLSYERSVNGETEKGIEELVESFERLMEEKNEIELIPEPNEEDDSGSDDNIVESKEIQPVEGKISTLSKEAKIERIDAMLQVVHATLAHIAHLRGNLYDALRILLEPQLAIPLGPAGKATILALEGAFLCEYGIDGNRKGYDLFKQALELDPDYWEWNYYAGKIIGRIRRLDKINDYSPEVQEMNLLEKAVLLHRQDASSLVHLANLYRVVAQIQHRYQMALQSQMDQLHPSTLPQVVRKKPISRHQWRANRDSDSKDESHKVKATLDSFPTQLINPEKNYLALAHGLYEEALSIESLCPYNNARCAKGLWSLPFPYKNKQKAQEAILQALRLAPDDTLVNHYAGLFYENVRDDEKALQCYERAIGDDRHNFSAELSYINLKLKVSPAGTYSPIFRLDQLLFKYGTSQYMIQTLLLKGIYLYKEARLYLHALRCFYKAIQIDPTFSILKKYYAGTYFGKYGDYYDIFQLCRRIAYQIIEYPSFQGDKKYFEDIIQEVKRLEELNINNMNFDD